MIPKAHRIIAAFILLFSFLLYLDTMAPTTSFWDCGEFIATAYIMGVPHPPGSPLFLLVGRLFTLLPLFGDIGARINIISPITSALAVMFLYLVIVQLVNKWRGNVETTTDAIITYGAGALGALTFMVTDSHWFNAVEAEVYATSTFLTAFTVWLILRWSQFNGSPSQEIPAEKDKGKSRIYYILLLAYLFGLAAGIHLLNLLTLPFVALIIYYRKWAFSWKGFLVTAGITTVVFLVIYQGIIKGLPRLASLMGLPGAALAVAVLVVVTVWVVGRRRKNASIILTSMLLVVVGYSTYATIFIRSQQDPAIDENDPETIRQAVAYLEREQYGDWSMLDRARWTPGTQHRYKSVGDFFWNYQVEKMYVRYFLWQFAGRGPSGSGRVSPYGATPSEDGVAWFQFGLPLALLLGFFGLYYHMRRDWKHGLAVLALFLATGLMIILYLNQPDPQPRERDYSYVGSFFAWSIWIGIGAGGLLELLSERVKDISLSTKSESALGQVLGGLAIIAIFGFLTWLQIDRIDKESYWIIFRVWFIPIPAILITGLGILGGTVLFFQGIASAFKRIMLSGALGVLLIIIPGVMLRANYHQHDRTGNYVAWDYSYNLLNSCKENSVLYTNGDNDTFPLWYLQEVEGIRKDVRVINLSLLNTDWYIRQLRDFEPRVPLSLSDEEIRQMTPIPWEAKTVRLPVNRPDHEPGYIEWTLKPTYAGRFLRVQDRMIVQTIRDMNWSRPIYFAVTVAPENKIGLDRYLEMQGLVYELKPNPARAININIERLRHNLLEVYRYRNLNDPSIYFNPNIQRLMQNLRASFLQLALDGIIKGQKEQAKAILDTLMATIPESVIPIRNKDLYLQVAELYAEAGDTTELRHRLTRIPPRFRLTPRDHLRIGLMHSQQLGDWQTAEAIFEDVYKKHPQNGQLVGDLVGIYQQTGHPEQAARILTDWLRFNPNDQNARRLLEQLQQ